MIEPPRPMTAAAAAAAAARAARTTTTILSRRGDQATVLLLLLLFAGFVFVPLPRHAAEPPHLTAEAAAAAESLIFYLPPPPAATRSTLDLSALQLAHTLTYALLGWMQAAPAALDFDFYEGGGHSTAYDKLAVMGRAPDAASWQALRAAMPAGLDAALQSLNRTLLLLLGDPDTLPSEARRAGVGVGRRLCGVARPFDGGLPPQPLAVTVVGIFRLTTGTPEAVAAPQCAELPNFASEPGTLSFEVFSYSLPDDQGGGGMATFHMFVEHYVEEDAFTVHSVALNPKMAPAQFAAGAALESIVAFGPVGERNRALVAQAIPAPWRWVGLWSSPPSFETPRGGEMVTLPVAAAK